MTAWVEEHFSDENRALTTLVWLAGIAGVIGFALVLGGMLLSR